MLLIQTSNGSSIYSCATDSTSSVKKGKGRKQKKMDKTIYPASNINMIYPAYTARDQIYDRCPVPESELRIVCGERSADQAELFMRVCRTIIRTDEGLYTWNQDRKLWDEVKNEYKPPSVKRAIVDVFSNYLKRAKFYGQLSQEYYHYLYHIAGSTKFVNAIYNFYAPSPNTDVADTMGEVNYRIPFAGGKVIDVRTKEISDRTYKDHFTWEVEAVYQPSLATKDNIFDKFIKSLWTNDKEYLFFRELCGKLVLEDEHHNYLLIWQHDQGGGGKTIFVNNYQRIFPHLCTILNQNLIKKNGRTMAFEMVKTRGKHLYYIDESTGDSAEDPYDFAKICELAGGGYDQTADKCQKISKTKAKKLKGVLMLLGNNGFLKNASPAAVNRRILYWRTLVYFRSIDKMTAADKANPYCKIADPKLAAKLEKNLDQCFTWWVNAAHEYVNLSPDKQDLISRQPDRFKDEWKAECNNTTILEEQLLNKFINSECVNLEGYECSVSRFTRAFNQFLVDHYSSSKDMYTQSFINDFIGDNKLGSPVIKQFNASSISNGSRIRRKVFRNIGLKSDYTFDDSSVYW